MKRCAFQQTLCPAIAAHHFLKKCSGVTLVGQTGSEAGECFFLCNTSTS